MANQLNLRVDENLRRSAEAIFEELGFGLPTAVNLFLRAVVRTGGMSFIPLDLPPLSQFNQSQQSSDAQQSLDTTQHMNPPSPQPHPEQSIQHSSLANIQHIDEDTSETEILSYEDGIIELERRYKKLDRGTEFTVRDLLHVHGSFLDVGKGTTGTRLGGYLKRNHEAWGARRIEGVEPARYVKLVEYES